MQNLVVLLRKEIEMRRLSLALLVFAIPAASAAAQVMIPTRVFGRPDRPAEKPPQAPGIHDARSFNRYKLSRFSLESSPMLAYMQTTGIFVPGVSQDYTSFGDATLISFRAAPSLFATGAFTASSLGAPFGMNTSDFGLRVKPWTAPRTAMFADVRYSYAYTSDFAMPSSAVPFAQIYSTAYTDFRRSRGNGALFGVGSETRLSARYSLTVAMNYTHYQMRTNNLDGTNWDYTNDATRLIVGVRYNHGRWLDAP
jgi:hypothetical protein